MGKGYKKAHGDISEDAWIIVAIGMIYIFDLTETAKF